MIELPEDTRVHKRIPKEVFYKHLQLNRNLKENFINDIENIYVEWALTTQNLHFSKEQEQDEIILLLIQLKKKEINSKILEVIAKQNPHKIVFVLTYNNNERLAIVRNKVFFTQWSEEKNTNLILIGFSIQEIWNGFIEQIAITDETVLNKDLTIDEKISKLGQIQKLECLISKTESAAWKETQPKKRFELYNLLESYRKKLEDIKNG